MSVFSLLGSTTHDNPFPGLRPFEPDEAGLFFGREEQCDELLGRLRRRRMVGVVGASGSGKSSLVRAGLIPALERGYLPSAGTAWHVAVSRPGADPLGNLARSLCARRTSEADARPGVLSDLREMLEASSLGLAAAARTLIPDASESLLVVVDQFEELFRFRRIGGPNAEEDAADFVKLLTTAAETFDVPLYVVLTMRSDYLGDCTQFAGLPEALNDTQYLVPQMTRDQLREAIEGPVSVSGGRVTPRLVQRLLHDVDRLAKGHGRNRTLPREPDPLPLLQHALMRVWEVSRDARERDEPMDLAHYEHPTVDTLWNALDLHAEEAYGELSDDTAKSIAQRAFQRLTERDPANREIRRASPLEELTAVALGLDASPTAPETDRVRGVLRHFQADGRSFLFFDQQDTVDISHESLIRQWKRLAGWVEEEAAAKQIFTTLTDSAQGWAQNERSLFRGPELNEALRWWRRQRPSGVWAERYGNRLDLAARFLRRSVLGRVAFRVAVSVGVLAIAALIWTDVIKQRQIVERDRDYAEKTEARERQFAELSQQRANELTTANALLQRALEAQKKGESGTADQLSGEATKATQRADAKPALRSDEAAELDLLRKLSAQWNVERRQLTKQVADLKQANGTAGSAARGGGGSATAPLPAPPVNQGPPQVALPPAATQTPVQQVSAGNYIGAFRDGVQAADLGNWSTTAQLMRDAIRFQPGNADLVTQVRIYGVRFEPYAPYTYLTLASLELKDCATAASAIRESVREVKPKGIEGRINQARKGCGL